MPKAKRPLADTMQPTPVLHFGSAECSARADLVRKYCESRFSVGEQSNGRHSITGEKHTELCSLPWAQGYLTIDAAGEAAEAAFQKYAEGKSGTLYWRVPPEIAWGAKQHKFAYYMRLLISDKPRKT